MGNNQKIRCLMRQVAVVLIDMTLLALLASRPEGAMDVGVDSEQALGLARRTQ